MSEGCLFCGIVGGSVSADVVRRSERSVAFRDIAPQAPVHVLVVPVEHIDDAGAVEAAHGEAVADLFVVAREVAEAEGVAETGYRVVFNVGEDASNTVGHLHMHLLGGRRMGWPPG